MDPELLAKLFAQSPLIAVIFGLLAAIRLLRAEHFEREKINKQTLDELIKRNDALQDENVAVLKENLKVQAAVEGRLASIYDLLKAQKGGG